MTNLRRALILASVLVTLVLLLFLGNLRAVAVSIVSIPLALLTAVLVLRAFGATLDIMVLGGLAIAIGTVVDDAVIDLENIWRHLRLAPPGTAADDLVLGASVEVRSAIVSTTSGGRVVPCRIILLGDWGHSSGPWRCRTRSPLASLVALTVLGSPRVAAGHTAERHVSSAGPRPPRAGARQTGRPTSMLAATIALSVGRVRANPLLVSSSSRTSTRPTSSCT
jgi:hypothetical protein